MLTPENTAAPLRSAHAAAAKVRIRIAQLRKELTETTAAYRSAKAAGDHTAVMLLLRKRSELIRNLFQAQSELLLELRSDTPDDD